MWCLQSPTKIRKREEVGLEQSEAKTIRSGDRTDKRTGRVTVVNGDEFQQHEAASTGVRPHGKLRAMPLAWRLGVL